MLLRVICLCVLASYFRGLSSSFILLLLLLVVGLIWRWRCRIQFLRWNVCFVSSVCFVYFLFSFGFMFPPCLKTCNRLFVFRVILSSLWWYKQWCEKTLLSLSFVPFGLPPSHSFFLSTLFALVVSLPHFAFFFTSPLLSSAAISLFLYYSLNLFHFIEYNSNVVSYMTLGKSLA